MQRAPLIAYKYYGHLIAVKHAPSITTMGTLWSSAMFFHVLTKCIVERKTLAWRTCTIYNNVGLFLRLVNRYIGLIFPLVSLPWAMGRNPSRHRPKSPTSPSPPSLPPHDEIGRTPADIGGGGRYCPSCAVSWCGTGSLIRGTACSRVTVVR